MLRDNLNELEERFSICKERLAASQISLRDDNHASLMMSSILKDLETICDQNDEPDMLIGRLDHLLLDYKTQFVDIDIEKKMELIRENDVFLDELPAARDLASVKGSLGIQSQKEFVAWNSLVNFSESFSE